MKKSNKPRNKRIACFLSAVLFLCASFLSAFPTSAATGYHTEYHDDHAAIKKAENVKAYDTCPTCGNFTLEATRLVYVYTCGDEIFRTAHWSNYYCPNCTHSIYGECTLWSGYYAGNMENIPDWDTVERIKSKTGDKNYFLNTFLTDIACPGYEVINTYAVAYNANGGSGKMENSQHTYDTAKKLTANVYTKEGYSFDGWNTKKDGSGDSYSNKASVKNLTTKNNGTVTLYAQWKAQKYTVTFDANGGSVDTTEKKVTFDNTYGTLPTPKRTGFTFKGWYTKQTSGDRVKKDTTVATAKDHTLFAHWTENDYTITYHPNGGNASVRTAVYHYDEEVNLGLASEKEGYTFIGWGFSPNSDKALTSLIMPDLATSENTDYSTDWELTLYALYTISVSDVANHTYPIYNKVKADEVSLYVSNGSDTSKKYNLTYKEDSGIMYYKYRRSKTDLSSYVGNENYGLKIVAYDNAGNEGVLYKEGIEVHVPKSYWQTVNHLKKNQDNWEAFDVKNDYIQEGSTYTPAAITAPAGYKFSHLDSSPYVVTSAKTSNAYYVPEIYTLTFDKNGGDSVSPASKQISYMERYGSLPIPVWRGHTFTGWFSEQTGGTEIKEEHPYNIAGNSTIYAHWNTNSYTVTYDYWTNGGTTCTQTENLSVNYGSDINVNPQSVTAVKEGWTFVGWNTNPDATTGLSSLKMSDSDVVLYAIYKKDINASFMDGNNKNTRNITSTIYNRTSSCQITIPPITELAEWNALGWSFDSPADAAIHLSPNVIYELSEDKTFYACYVQDITITYDTAGSAQTIPAQTQQRYFNASGDYHNPSFTIASAPFLDRHSFVTWEELDETGRFIQNYTAGSIITADHGMTLKAKWDMYPEIEAYDRYFTLDDARNGSIPAERLFEKVTATDKEDGTLRNGIDVTILNFNPSDFVSLPDVQITYQAKDSFGNITEKSITVYVVDTTVTESPIKYYSRFIHNDFYAVDGSLLSPEFGGLEATSIWKTNKNYQRILEHALNTDTPIHIFHFSQEELSE